MRLGFPSTPPYSLQLKSPGLVVVSSPYVYGLSAQYLLMIQKHSYSDRFRF